MFQGLVAICLHLSLCHDKCMTMGVWMTCLLPNPTGTQPIIIINQLCFIKLQLCYVLPKLGIFRIKVFTEKDFFSKEVSPNVLKMKFQFLDRFV